MTSEKINYGDESTHDPSIDYIGDLQAIKFVDLGSESVGVISEPGHTTSFSELAEAVGDRVRGAKLSIARVACCLTEGRTPKAVVDIDLADGSFKSRAVLVSGSGVESSSYDAEPDKDRLLPPPIDAYRGFHAGAQFFKGGRIEEGEMRSILDADLTVGDNLSEEIANELFPDLNTSLTVGYVGVRLSKDQG